MIAFATLTMVGCIALAFLVESAVQFAASQMTKRRLTAERLASLTVHLSRYER